MRDVLIFLKSITVNCKAESISAPVTEGSYPIAALQGVLYRFLASGPPQREMNWATVMASALVLCLSRGTEGISKKDRWLESAQKAAQMGNLIKFKFPEAPHLMVAAESWPPHIQVNPVTDKNRIEGPMANFLHALALSLNFTFTVVQGDGYWGAPLGNGSWNGMIGMVLRKEADIGLGPFGMSYIRSQVVDFTMPLFSEVLHILVARPTAQPDPWGFVTPLTWPVWTGTMLSFILVVVVSTVIDLTLESSVNPKPTNHFWVAYQIFISQNLKAIEGVSSLRTVTLVWMTAILIISRSYSGAMTSMLAVKTVPLKYDSLRDVLDDSKVRILMEGSTALTAHLQTVKEGIYKDLADALKTRGTFVKASDMQEVAYESIPKGRSAMLLEAVGCNKIYSDHFRKTGSIGLRKWF